VAKDEKGPEPPKEKAAKKPVKTPQDFVDALDSLINEAIEAGVRPTPLIVRVLARQGMSMLDVFLDGLDGGKDQKKRKKPSA